jgi:hypothetical protein
MTSVSRLENIRELLQSAHWAARDLQQDTGIDVGRLLDQIHAARTAAESAHSALCRLTTIAKAA